MVLTIPTLSPPAAMPGLGRHSGLPVRLGESSVATWRCFSSRKEGASFTDRILDYIEGGPKLRKWYRTPKFLPKDSGGVIRKEKKSQTVHDFGCNSHPDELIVI